MLKNGYELMQHQKEAIIFVKNNKKVMISLPTGGGKTLLSLVIYRLYKNTGVVNKILYITLTSVCHQIKENEDEFFDKPINNIINMGNMSPKKRVEAYLLNPNALVINYQKVNNDISKLMKYVDKNTFIVLDEAVAVKNTSSKISSNIKNLVSKTDHILPMTATPIMKNIEDIKNILGVTKVLIIGDKVFKDNFCKIEYQRVKPFKRFGKVINKIPVIVGYKNTRQFFDLLKDKVFYKNKSELKNIPPVGCSVVFVDKNKMSKKAIKSIDNPNDIQIDKAENYPSLILEEVTPLSPKHNYIANYIINNADNKVFIYTKYRNTTTYLSKLFEKYYDIKSISVYGGVDVGEVKKKFINDNSIKCIIGNDSISTGYDGLQKVADTVIFADMPYSFGNYQQIIGRVIRTGSKFNMVNIVIPIVKNNIDEIRLVHVYSQISLLIKNNKSMVDDGTYDKMFIKQIDGLYDDEWVKKEVYRKYKVLTKG